jgi:hypothetical protein
MKSVGRVGSVFLVLALGSAIPAFAAGVSYTCDPSIAADGPAGLCTFLNSTVDPLYNNTFTNTTASIYIEFSNNNGLADNTTNFVDLVPYTEYRSALDAESTDAAKATLPGTEPAIFGGDQIALGPALAGALGIATFGTTPTGTVCFTPGSNGCYSGILQVNIPSDLQAQHNQGYTYRGLGGSTTDTTSNYDFFSVVEHETDEILGTASCIETGGAGGTLVNPLNCAGAIDLFRYTSAGTRTFDTIGTTGYFSADSGDTVYDGNVYNDQANGQDWADFNQFCTFVQDDEGCLNQSFDITNDGPGGTAGPEVAMLNAIGYDLVSSTPEPGTLGLLGFGFTTGAIVYRRRRGNRSAA